MLDRINMTFLSEKFLRMTAYYLIDTNENHCSSHDSTSRHADGINLSSGTTFAVTDNSTDVRTGGGANDSSRL